MAPGDEQRQAEIVAGGVHHTLGHGPLQLCLDPLACSQCLSGGLEHAAAHLQPPKHNIQLTSLICTVICDQFCNARGPLAANNAGNQAKCFWPLKLEGDSTCIQRKAVLNHVLLVVKRVLSIKSSMADIGTSTPDRPKRLQTANSPSTPAAGNVPTSHLLQQLCHR